MKRSLLFGLLLFISGLLSANAQTTVWTLDSQEAFLEGDTNGTSVTSKGHIVIAPKLDQVYTTGQSYIWSTAADKSSAVYLGTGGEGKIFKVTSGGNSQLFADLAELNVTALAIGRDDQLFAATSPDGKVYRISRDGRAEVYFEPNEKYIWSLAAMPDGSLVVGTGGAGRIYKVTSAGRSAADSLMFETGEDHVMTLASDGKGSLYAGTDGSGLVIRFDQSGKAFGVLDSPLREIHDLTIGPDGSVYAVAIAESAATTPTTENKDAKTTKPAATVKAATPKPTPKSKNDLTGAKSALYRISPDGESDILWSSTSATAYSALAGESNLGVYLGTSEKGRVFQISNNGDSVLLAQTDGDLVSRILQVGEKIFAATSNQGKLYSFSSSNVVADGYYLSPVMDAASTATWGRLWWRSSGNVSMQTRSGNSETPNKTWSDWSSPINSQTGTVAASPKAKYIQWRALLKGRDAVVYEANLAYLAKNLAPDVLSIQVLPIDVGLAPNPPVQIDPNIELNGLDPAAFGITIANVAPRKVYQRAARSFQWTAEDRNSDKLRYDVYFRNVKDVKFTRLAADKEENFITIDTRSLIDGVYELKVVAKDHRSNHPDRGLSGESITEPFVIDNTPPTVALNGRGKSSAGHELLRFTANDKGSYIARAEYSVNGGEWIRTFPDDLITDSPEEKFTIGLLTDITPLSITIRVFDSNGNWTSETVQLRN